jgi:hypothetical protein
MTSGGMTTHPSDAQEPVGQVLREVFDLIDETVASITNDRVDARLARLLDRSEGTDAGASTPKPTRRNGVAADEPTAVSRSETAPHIGETTTPAPLEQQSAAEMVAAARADAHRIVAAAQAQADDTLDRAAALIVEAHDQAKRIVAAARAKAEGIAAAAAQAEAAARNAEPAAADTTSWLVEDQVSVSVDGSRVWNDDRGRPEPAVVIRMPAHYARHLAAVLDDWSTIGRLLESARGAEERELATALHEAARVAETTSRSREPGSARSTLSNFSTPSSSSASGPAVA